MRALACLFRYLRPYRGAVILSISLTVIATALNLVQPESIQRAVDRGITPHDPNAVLLASLALLPILVLVTRAIGRRVRSAYRENQAMVGQLSGYLSESVSAVRLVKSFHKEDATFEVFRKLSARARDAGTRAETASFSVHPVMRIVNGFAAALVVGVGGYLAISMGGSTYTAGLLSAFLIYSSRFCEVLDTEPEITSKPDAVAVSDIRGDVAFEHVTFGYLPDQTVVDDITVDGVDVRDLELDSLRTRMGVVLQEPYFFADTIMANIKYGKPSATDDEAIAAARISQRR